MDNIWGVTLMSEFYAIDSEQALREAVNKLTADQKAQLLGASENMLVVQVGYNRYILPFKKGMELLNLLETAECFEEHYSTGTSTICPIPYKQKIEFSILSKEAYVAAKLMHTLNPTNP